VAVDGITFSLPNTPGIQRRCRKGGNQKGRNPFAKLAAAALVELAMHNPLAARLGVQGESEWRLAQGLLAHLPEQCLLLADRLYGCGAFLLAAQTALSARQGYFLVRVKMGLKIVRPLQRLPDGSRLVLIQALDPQDYHRVTGTLVVREIRAVLRRRGERDLHERFWTSLLDPVAAPAPELVRLYMRRWEQELYFRELKYELGINDLLRSQTVETAAQEVAAALWSPRNGRRYARARS
jgi:hypothetical protein